MPNLNTARYTGDEEMPDLSKHNNWMAKIMTPELSEQMQEEVHMNGSNGKQPAECSLKEEWWRYPVII